MKGAGVFPVRPGLFVPWACHVQGYHSSLGVLHTHEPPSVARRAVGQLCFARVIRQGYEQCYQGVRINGGLRRRYNRLRLRPDGSRQKHIYALRVLAQA